jgi:hypothetical protein
MRRDWKQVGALDQNRICCRRYVEGLMLLKVSKEISQIRFTYSGYYGWSETKMHDVGMTFSGTAFILNFVKTGLKFKLK